MKMKFTVFASVAVLAACVLSDRVSAQSLGNLRGVAAGGATSEATAGRAQAQVQQRIQAQVQQQIQTQVQGRVQAEARRAAEGAQRAATQAARRADAAVQSIPQGAQVRGGANASTQTHASAAGNSAQLDTRTRIGVAAGTSLPPGLSQADVAIYDNVFGRFSPLRSISAAMTADGSGSGGNLAKASGLAGAVAGQSSQQWSTESSIPELASHLDFAAQIQLAMRQRRAEISQMRDQAVASGETALLAHADELEKRLNSFVAAQAKVQPGAQYHADADFGPTERTIDPKARTASNAQAQGVTTLENGESVRGRGQVNSNARAHVAEQTESAGNGGGQANTNIVPPENRTATTGSLSGGNEIQQ